MVQSLDPHYSSPSLRIGTHFCTSLQRFVQRAVPCSYGVREIQDYQIVYYSTAVRTSPPWADFDSQVIQRHLSPLRTIFILKNKCTLDLEPTDVLSLRVNLYISNYHFSDDGEVERLVVIHFDNNIKIIFTDHLPICAFAESSTTCNCPD
jgi:hypothetical protein